MQLIIETPRIDHNPPRIDQNPPRIDQNPQRIDQISRYLTNSTKLPWPLPEGSLLFLISPVFLFWIYEPMNFLARWQLARKCLK